MIQSIYIMGACCYKESGIEGQKRDDIGKMIERAN